MKTETKKAILTAIDADETIAKTEKLYVKKIIDGLKNGNPSGRLVSTHFAKAHYGLSATTLRYLAERGIIHEQKIKNNVIRWIEKELLDYIDPRDITLDAIDEIDSINTTPDGIDEIDSINTTPDGIDNI